MSPTITLRTEYPDGTSEEERDDLDRSLVEMFHDHGLSVTAVTSAVPVGGKPGELVAIGAFLLQILPAAIPKTIELIQALLIQSPQRKVIIKVSIESASLELELPYEKDSTEKLLAMAEEFVQKHL